MFKIEKGISMLMEIQNLQNADERRGYRTEESQLFEFYINQKLNRPQKMF